MSTHPKDQKEGPAVCGPAEEKPGRDVSAPTTPPSPPSPLPSAAAARGASPGLLHRRYSVPEVVMRKCWLNQDKSKSNCVGDSSPRSARCACAGVSPRELVRRDALLRRMRGRAAAAAGAAPVPATAPAAPAAPDCCRLFDETESQLLWGRGSRSLEGSRSELRSSSYRVQPPTSSENRNYGRWQNAICVDSYSCHSNHPSVDSEGEISQLKCEFVDLISDETRKMHYNEDDEWTSKKQVSTLVFHPSSENHIDNTNKWQKTTTSASSYDVLEIIVSESLDAGRNSDTPAQTPSGLSAVVTQPSKYLVDLDEYVSDILVESLNSLTDRLENVTSSIDGDRKISIVEREIKVKLQNTGVNTVVHLSPMSNNQIIFGNEELYDRDNHEEVLTKIQNGNEGNKRQANEIPTAPDSSAALLRLRKLFNDDPQNNDKNNYININSNDEMGALSIEVKNAKSEDVRPLSVSLEVNASSDDEISPCASLVDSLDDPESPRTSARRLQPRPALRRHAPLVRSAIAVLDLPPETSDAAPRLTVPDNSTVAERSESFFIPIKDEDYDSVNPHIVVADRMPEKIKQRLCRRHRRREMRQERVRRFRRSDREDIRRECLSIVDALIDNVVMKIAREEFRNMYVRKRVADKKSNKKVPFDTRYPSGIDIDDQQSRTNCDQNIVSHDAALPIQLRDCDPRRLYRKSEIRDGSECIEILEILEYMAAPTSRECSEITSDESANGARSRRSRIPVPVHEAPRRPGPRLGHDDTRTERVFEVIPEELVTRDSASVRRCSSSEIVGTHPVAAAPRSPGTAEEPHNTGLMSVATSPLRPVDRGCGGVTLRDAATMTSPPRAALKARTRGRSRLEESLSSQGIPLCAHRARLTHTTRF